VSASEHPRLTILVVEDEWLVRLAITDFLRASNCEVVEARSGEAAVEALRNGYDIDAVFTDIRLGGEVNGWDVGEASRAQDPDMPVVYTSGAVLRPERPVSGSMFFAKPYDQAKVLDACRTLCAARP
jgi:CheY-like chemotaxis protein